MAEPRLARLAEHARTTATTATDPAVSLAWLEIAEEVDACLAPADAGPDLFGGAA